MIKVILQFQYTGLQPELLYLVSHFFRLLVNRKVVRIRARWPLDLGFILGSSSSFYSNRIQTESGPTLAPIQQKLWAIAQSLNQPGLTYIGDALAYNVSHHHFRYSDCTNSLPCKTTHLRNRPSTAPWNKGRFVTGITADMCLGNYNLKHQGRGLLSCPRFLLALPSPCCQFLQQYLQTSEDIFLTANFYFNTSSYL